MISDIVALDSIDPNLKASVIKKLNLMMHSGTPVVRYTWSELKYIAMYINANGSELASCGEDYTRALMAPYNKFEYALIFDIAMAYKHDDGSDLAPIRLRVRADNQRLRRTVRKMLAPVVPVVVEKKSMISKIKSKIGGKTHA